MLQAVAAQGPTATQLAQMAGALHWGNYTRDTGAAGGNAAIMQAGTNLGATFGPRSRFRPQRNRGWTRSWSAFEDNHVPLRCTPIPRFAPDSPRSFVATAS